MKCRKIFAHSARRKTHTVDVYACMNIPKGWLRGFFLFVGVLGVRSAWRQKSTRYFIGKKYANEPGIKD